MTATGSTFRIPTTIARAYSLENSAISEFESYGNKNWLVEDGAGRRYVLRRQRLNAAEDRLGLQLALQEHLAERGMPVPRVLETTSGQQFARDDDGVPWILLGYVEGEEYDFERPQQAFEAARTLARVHLHAQSFAGDGPPPEHKAPLRECWADPLGHLAGVAAMLDGTCAGELSELREWWHEILLDWPIERFDTLPSGWIHGDFHGRNLVFDGDRVAGLLDFDDVVRGPYVYDVASGALKLGRTSRKSNRLRIEFTRAFLDGYESWRKLTGDERAILPLLMAMIYPPHPRYYRFWRDHRGEDLPEFVRKEVGIMRELRAEVARVAPELFQR